MQWTTAEFACKATTASMQVSFAKPGLHAGNSCCDRQTHLKWSLVWPKNAGSPQEPARKARLVSRHRARLAAPASAWPGGCRVQPSHRLSSLVGLALMPSGGTVLICFRSDISLQTRAHNVCSGSLRAVRAWVLSSGLLETLVHQLDSAPESCRGGGMALHDASWDWGDQVCSGP